MSHAVAENVTGCQRFDALEEAAPQFGIGAHAAPVNLKEGKAFCLMSGPDEEAVRKAHEAVQWIGRGFIPIRLAKPNFNARVASRA